MDLYNVLSQAAQTHKVRWDDLEAAHVDEYCKFGKIVTKPDSIYEPDGSPLFPELRDSEDLYSLAITTADVQLVAYDRLGRELTHEEVKAVAEKLPYAVDWLGAIETAIEVCRETGRIQSVKERASIMSVGIEPDDLDLVSRPDVQRVALEKLGRMLTDMELGWVVETLPDGVDWETAVETTIESLQALDMIGPAGEEEEGAWIDE